MEANSAFEAGRTVGAILAVVVVLAVAGLTLLSFIMALVKRTKGWIIAAVFFGMFGLAAVAFGVVAFAKGVKQGFNKAKAAAVDKKVVSSDGQISLQVPANWDDLPELHADAALKVGNKFREEYAIVISEPKTDFEGTLQKYSEITTGAMRENLENGTISNVQSLTIGGLPAIQCRVSGTTQNIKIIYLHTSIETPDGFHQLMLWTLPSKEATAWPVFERVAKSFQLERK